MLVQSFEVYDMVIYCFESKWKVKLNFCSTQITFRGSNPKQVGHPADNLQLELLSLWHCLTVTVSSSTDDCNVS